MSKSLKRIYALHGLGGSPNDWNILEEELKGSGFLMIKADSYNPSIMRQIEKEETNVVVITHSWGAYVLIKSMSQFNITEKIEKVILVNPYIEVENPLKPLIAFLLRIPFLGDRLIKLSHKRGATHFLQKMISPYKYLDIPYFKDIDERLNNLSEWRKCIRAKIRHQSEVFNIALNIDFPTDVLVGLRDKAAQNGFQLNIIKKIFKNIEIHEFANEGHGILWTQAKKIKEILKSDSKNSVVTEAV